MKKIILLGVLFTLIVNAEITEKCTGCHGKNFGTSALGKSGIVRDMTKNEIIKSINGYKKGTLNKYGMGALMKGQVSGLSDKEVQEIADTIVNKKKVKDSIKKLASCKSIPKLTKDEIINVINKGSHKYDCPMGEMFPKMVKEAKEIATYLINGMQGTKPKSFNVCTTCHGDDARGMNGMSPDISHLGNFNESKDIASKGKWIINEEKSPIDDSLNITLYLESTEIVRDKYNKEQTPTLILRCSENTTNAFINWSMFIGTGYTDVLIRLDKEKAKTSSWIISTNYEAIFPKKNISFIKKLMKHEKLLTQITPYGENPVMTTFDIKGLKEAIKPLRKACGW